MATRHKRDKNGYYRVDISIGKDPYGNLKRVTIRAKTIAELEVHITEVKMLSGRGVVLDEITVADWAMRWLAVYKANASPTQQAHYRVKVEQDILPAVGHMFLRDVRPSHLQELLNSYSGGKASTVQKVKQAIQQLFADAEVEGLIIRSPASRLELPSLSETIRRPLTNEERLAVWKVAQSHKAGAFPLYSRI